MVSFACECGQCACLLGLVGSYHEQMSNRPAAAALQPAAALQLSYVTDLLSYEVAKLRS